MELSVCIRVGLLCVWSDAWTLHTCVYLLPVVVLGGCVEVVGHLSTSGAALSVREWGYQVWRICGYGSLIPLFLRRFRLLLIVFGASPH